MGHRIQAIIARSDFIAPRVPSHWPRLVALDQGYALVPVTHEMLDEVPRRVGDEVVDGFIYLAPSWQVRLAELSAGGELVYIETDYFGGQGNQGAVVYRDRSSVLGPQSGECGPISEALASIGVSKSGACDEFEAVGLVRFRRMDDFEPQE